MMRRRLSNLKLMILACCACAPLTGCQEYRTEYHTRPGFYEKASAFDLPSEVVLDDGTRVVYADRSKVSQGARPASARKRFSLREEHENGDVTLNAVIPEHVLVNTLICLRREEYSLLWEQMLAESTRQAYGNDKKGYEQFESYMRKYRTDLGRTLTRMVKGLPHQQVAMASMGDGITRCALRSQFSDGFKFTRVDAVREDDGQMRLLMIK
ncbi:MAG: hypothetical protein AAF432_13805 [Planctomycetota bacterium]